MSTPEKEVILSLSHDKGDFTLQFFRASGHGGQNVNKRSTAARVVHPASGAAGQSQTFRTQGENKREAFRRLVESPRFKEWLRITLAEMGIQGAPQGPGKPTGDRGEKVRTYNFPRGEVICHDTGKRYPLGKILDGYLDEIINDTRQAKQLELFPPDET
jgi:peptide chain release factor 1